MSKQCKESETGFALFIFSYVEFKMNDLIHKYIYHTVLKF